ncbi:flagellin [Bacillus alkalicellulosilyticus]|uniref:flagellin n=1 Tax=Alkalihalobacterium alkalicellulosilyticum TaxID=1912214 RepID=UPI0009968DB7|nr:flagellin [Bacillus alkalicellulosilyticus]
MCSTGLRISQASDDWAGLSISQKMRAQIRGLSQSQRNIQDGISLVQTAESGLGQITDLVQRMRELTVHAANETLSATDLENINNELQQSMRQIDTIANYTYFYSRGLLNVEASNPTTTTIYEEITTVRTILVEEEVTTEETRTTVITETSLRIEPPGDVWVKRVTNTPQNITDIVYNGTVYTAVGSQGVILSSSDVENWSTIPSPSHRDMKHLLWERGNLLLLVPMG